ncbi:molybdopterin-guanine dinucleotide biosynthesis protein B [Acidithiobacillus sp. IBUN Pt1247-S3]|uniref:molybdopterin-guanine dinucleotide biosynthesis protein B n=1 Tax=Acidithiobacillus sp. IBUN Pt1247-S3 TaxID=3166642 RepID=UPI0034E378DA
MKTLAIIGYSGSGKTTLLCALIPWLRKAGLRVAAIKATHHDVRWDEPGKDSWRLQEAGAEPLLLVGPQRWYLNRVADPGNWAAMLASLQPEPDLVLSEGNQDWPIPRLLVHRAALEKGLRWDPGDDVLAVASDTPLDTSVPCLDLNDPAAIAQFILHWYGE